MPVSTEIARNRLLAGLNDRQCDAVSTVERRLMVIAGAGSGKTEVMARRVAWWVAIDQISKDSIVAFTFTQAAAQELKFRIRTQLQQIATSDEDAALGGMHVGTIHGFCLRALREFASPDYYMFDVLDDAGRIALLAQGGYNVLALEAFEHAARTAGAASSRAAAYQLFLDGYDQLNEHGILHVNLPPGTPPADVADEREWCRQAALAGALGESELSVAFSDSAARYYAYLRARRFFDFGTVQSELISRIRNDATFRTRFRERWSHLVVDEIQDINPVQNAIIREIVGSAGRLTAVGDHRQAIYAFRGGRVDLMGQLYQDVAASDDGCVIELPANYRSTPRIIAIANEWSRTIDQRGGMTNPDMEHGREGRRDARAEHVALLHFSDRDREAAWIADTIDRLVNPRTNQGAIHDHSLGVRGITYSDIAILVRSGTDIRAYQNALSQRGVPAVVRGGPDLFSQEETLLVLSAFALAADVTQFMGNAERRGTLPNRINDTLGVTADPASVIPAAAAAMRRRDILVPEHRVTRLLNLANALRRRIPSDRGIALTPDQVNCREARAWIGRNTIIRRVFPQQIFHWLLEEIGIAEWGESVAAEAARFHVGQVSKLIKGLETSGWTQPRGLKWQVLALLYWGAQRARSEEAPLLVSPNAVSITTIHSSKGLEFGAVFLADVNARRFPSNQARRQPPLPFDLAAVPEINPARLADNENNDDERRLLYVALTRAERYLFVTCSGHQTSKFITELRPMFTNHGGTVRANTLDIAQAFDFADCRPDAERNFSSTFSDIRYFTECPHDFYMRVVMGYTPTVGQEFGYGRGVHNLLRTVHEEPQHWASMASNPRQLRAQVERLVDGGLFYLRYTTGEPLRNLKAKAVQGVTAYIRRYADELASLSFEPEKEFETLITEERLLVAGAIDVVRLDDPPRVTIMDFKSGDAKEDTSSRLSRDLMAMQIGIYGLAARTELEYDPQHGLVRYIGETDPTRIEMSVDLGEPELERVRSELIATARSIRQREFSHGPRAGNEDRCRRCDFCNICRLSNARGQ